MSSTEAHASPFGSLSLLPVAVGAGVITGVASLLAALLLSWAVDPAALSEEKQSVGVGPAQQEFRRLPPRSVHCWQTAVAQPV